MFYITNYDVTVRFEQLVVFQLVKKLIKFDVNHRFLTVFLRVRCHSVQSQMKPFHTPIPFI